MFILKYLLLLLIPVILIGGTMYTFFGGTIASNAVTTSSLRKLFNEQANIFTQPLAALGIPAKPTSTVECVEDHQTKWSTYYSCEDYYSYPTVITPISDAAKATYEVNAAKVDQLLTQNGWVANSPEATVNSVAGSDPYTPTNGGVGGEVPFHKTVGPITCALEVTFSSLDGGLYPGSINVNEFSCEQVVQVFTPHLG